MSNEKPSLDDFLMHYGIDHIKGTPGSGRYPWGSGDSPFQHSGDFLSFVKELRSKRLTYTDNEEYILRNGEKVKNPDYGKTFKGETAVAKMLKMSTTEYRQAITLASNLDKMDKINRAEALWNTLDENGNHKYGYSEIARKMGLPNESSVRSLLKPSVKANIEVAQKAADFLKERLTDLSKDDPKAMIDIGPGVEKELGITRTKLDNAVYILEGEGYKTYGGRIPNVTDPTGSRQTTMNVIATPETEFKDFYNYEHIKSLKEYEAVANGKDFKRKFEYPESMDPKRLMIRYAEEGGKEKDGLIELRRNVPDLSLGEKNYAQVRILVDGDRYLKGMAAYATDQSKFPDGVDVIFNTNKHVGTEMRDVLKKIKDDPDNPFGSLIKDSEQGGQYYYDSKTGKRLESKFDSPNAKLGLINKRSDEGDWDNWKDTLSAQFLSKQNLQLVKRQLNVATVEKQQELDDIKSLTNNTVKKYYLDSFANDCDYAAVHLTAAALPRQKFQVLLPVPSMKDNEIYAPNYNDGERVALIRYPHGGLFEIPILTVNNKQKDAVKLIGKNSRDAVGINAEVADRLSGADFDGDTAMVIPISSRSNVKNAPRLKGLEGFDPKDTYGCDPKKTYTDAKGNEHYFNKAGIEFKVMKNTQNEMGRISNLITDMTIKGATNDELARAVRHSMVVIDAEKHKLDYKSSYVQNGIEALKKKYQLHLDENGKEVYGASTLVSMAKSEKDVVKRKGQPRVNIKGRPDYDPTRPEGALLYKDDPKATYTVLKENKRTGEITQVTKVRTQPSTKMAETDDARTLISSYNSPIEQAYAAYANTMKAMANSARKLSYETKGVEYSSKAAKLYAKEVRDLESQLDVATKNKPRERQAQVIATCIVKAKKQSNPDMKKSELKKLRQQEITRAREQVGATKTKIEITDRMWEAIQSGAVHANTLRKVFDNTDMSKVKERATPRSRKTITPAMESRAKQMKLNGRSNAEIAMALGLSSSTVSKLLAGEQ